MTLWEIHQELQLLAAVYGWDTPTRNWGVKGDTIGDVWYDEEIGCIYIH